MTPTIRHAPEESVERQAGHRSSLRWIRWMFAAMGIVALAALAFLPVHRHAVSIDVSSPRPGNLQVFFDQGQGLSEALSVTRSIPAGRSTVFFPLFAGTTNLIRVDPPAGIPDLVIHSLTIAPEPQPVFRQSAGLSVPLPLLNPAHQIVAAESTNTGAVRFIMSPEANDPRIVYTPVQPLVSGPHSVLATRATHWGLLLFACLGLFVTRHGRIRAPLLLLAGAVAGLILAMAVASPQARSTHPDEFLHIADAEYFSEHWLPPRLDAAALTPSLQASVYGVSYLFEWNVVYLIAGKTGRALMDLDIQPVLAYRLFNVALFMVLIGFMCAFRMPAYGFLAILATPQVWYIFSYLNGDALPFTLAAIAVAVATDKKRGIQSFMTGGKVDWRLVAFMGAVGLLLISKRNYWPTIAFVLIYLSCSRLGLRKRESFAAVVALLALVTATIGGDHLLASYRGPYLASISLLLVGCGVLLARWAWRDVVHSTCNRAAALRLAGCMAAALMVASPWIAADMVRNSAGSGKSALITELRNEYAAPAFKPETLATTPEASRSGLALASKGVELHELLSQPYGWMKSTYRSFFGGYGYMRYFGSTLFYFAIGMALLGALISSILAGLRTGMLTGGHLIAVIGSSATIVIASLLHSWTYDFQPQGRYVLGVLPLLIPVFVAAPRTGLSGRIFVFFAVATIVMGLYSFARTGLVNLT